MENNTVAQESKVSIPSISIPTRSIWSLVGFIAVCGFGYLQFVHFLFPGFAEIFSDNESNPIDFSTSMRLVWVPIVTYIILGTGIYLLINTFKKLKGYKEKSLIRCLAMGFIFGLMAGGTAELIKFVTDAPGVLIGITYGLAVGLITVGLVIGLLWEFSTE